METILGKLQSPVQQYANVLSKFFIWMLKSLTIKWFESLVQVYMHQKLMWI